MMVGHDGPLLRDEHSGLLLQRRDKRQLVFFVKLDSFRRRLGSSFELFLGVLGLWGFLPRLKVIELENYLWNLLRFFLLFWFLGLGWGFRFWGALLSRSNGLFLGNGFEDGLFDNFWF